jgi:5-methylcytosine-specific restriction endonuclease McrA
VDCGRGHYLIDPHHKLERSKGGDDHLSNLETNCRPCHSTKKGQVQLRSIA